MRARSANTFTIDDLREIARTCDEHGMKSYLTVNTIIYDDDLELMRTIVDAAKEAGISAVIAADVAVMSYARRIGQEVHLSTQLNISNVEALRFYAQFADVVVLARELNLEPSYPGREYLWSFGGTDTHRDVLSRCIVHGSFGQMLSFIA